MYLTGEYLIFAGMIFLQGQGKQHSKDANFFIIFIPENICLSDEEIWRYYILLFGDIGGVGTMEYDKYVESGKKCDHV